MQAGNRFAVTLSFWSLGAAGFDGCPVFGDDNQPPSNVGAALVSSNLRAFAFKRTRLEIASAVFPAFGAYRGRVFYNTNTTYYIKVFGHVDWNLSFYGNWDTRLRPRFSGSDYGTSTGLSWTFGTK